MVRTLIVLFCLLSVPVLRAEQPAVQWPPKLGEPYPDLNLLDQEGHRVALSSFKGKIIIVEPVGIPCSACQAFSGAHHQGIGPYGGFTPQQDLKSFEEYVADYAKGVKFDSPDIVFVQLLLYNPQMRAPSPDEGKAWASHFQMDRSKNRVVLVGEDWMVSPASYNMIPGFQLIDRDFVLRSDATGHQPPNDLWKHFFPALKKLAAK